MSDPQGNAPITFEAGDEISMEQITGFHFGHEMIVPGHCLYLNLIDTK